MKLPIFAALAFCVAQISPAATPWHHPLVLSQGRAWSLRQPVRIENRSDAPAAGELVEVELPELIGRAPTSLRVCDEAGHELLFDVRDRSGSSRREAPMAAGDRVVLPVECAAHATATLYVYFDREWQAADPGEYLPSWFSNGSFEAGKSAPLGWKPAETDAAHRAVWDRAAGRQGGACGRVEVDAGAPPTWAKWQQDGMRVAPGARYRVSGWVRAQDVQGEAGWFVHVNGDQPMLLQSMLHAGGGTYDWKQVSFEFTAPPNARTATLGTVLRGTGTAWFDDAEFVTLDGGDRWRVEPLPVERLDLKREQTAAPDSFSAEWPARVVVRALNLAEHEAQGVVTIDLRSVRARLRDLPGNAALRVVAAGTGEEIAESARSGDSLLFPASLPPRSERLFHLYFSSAKTLSPAEERAALARLTQSPSNLAPNPAFEPDGAKVRAWTLAGPGHLVSPGLIGARALELNIPPSEKPAWSGWRSQAIPVAPRTTYLFAAFAQAKNMVGRAQLYVHLHDAAGKFTPSRSMQSSAGSVTGDTEWTSLSAFVETAPEAATAELHLTTNGTGTLRHDGVLFCRAMPADVVRIENAASLETSNATRVWQVNPLVKIFPDTPPGPRSQRVEVECARNEYEPFELVLRSGRTAAGVEVRVSPLVSESGAALPPVRVDRVGFVPIDHPSGYFRFEGPDWYRPIPNHQGSTDGWAGEWPDPLIPNGPFPLEANRAQPLWFTVQAPAAAAPGEYLATIEIVAEGAATKIPLTVRVLPFALPAETHLKVIFDFRFGRGGDYGMAAPELKSQWMRLLADHRLGINMIEPAPEFTYHAGKVHMDAAAFDQAASLCFDHLGLGACYLPQFFYSFGWAYPAKEIFGLKPFTPEFNAAFKQAYKLMSDHLRERGWHDRFVYYVSDEPHYGEPHVVEQMIKLCALAHEADPTIPIYSSTWTHFPTWDESLDIWGAGHHGIFPVEEMADLRRRGKHIWFTCDGQMAIDTPYLATERTLPYYCHKYGAEGFEFWGLSWWTLDPWTHGWHSFIRQSDDGKTFYSTRYPDGDGYLTYPGEKAGAKGPVNSIRLEQLREGLEDYEALKLLTDLMAKAKESGRSTALAEHAITAAHDLVTIPNSSGLRTSENLPDPDKLPAARRLVNAAIVSLLP